MSFTILLIYIRGDYSVHIPNGLLQIAAVLEKEHDVIVIDPLFKDWNKKVLDEINPDIIGLSYLSFNIIQTKKIIEDIKNYDDSIPIIAGGSHPSMKPVEALNELGMDFAVIGEGEKIIPSLLKELSKPHPNLKNVRGIVYKDENEKIIKTKKEELIEDIDTLPFPARHLVDMEEYLVPPGYIRSVLLDRVATMYTSRGCSYMCNFCAIPIMFQRQLRFHSIDYVMKQIRHLKKTYDIDGLYFSDEVFTIDRERTLKLCKQLKKINLPWGTQTRVDLVDKSLLHKMSEAGCVQLDYGVESGSDRVLKKMRKGIDRSTIIETFKNTKEAGIRTFATITLGHPSETEKDLKDTVSLIKKIKPNFTLAQFLTPIPGTYDYHWAVKENKIEEDYYKKTNYHFYTSNMPLVNISNVSDKVLAHYKKKIDNITFKWNYLSLVNFQNFKFLSRVIFSNFMDIPLLADNLKEFFNSGNVDKLIMSLLNTYQKRRTRKS